MSVVHGDHSTNTTVNESYGQWVFCDIGVSVRVNYGNLYFSIV